MSTQTQLVPSNELGANPSDVYKSTVDSLDSIIATLNHQLLNNVECVLALVKDERQRKELESAFEGFFKMPIRRQVGRLNKASVILKKFSVPEKQVTQDSVSQAQG